MANPAGYYAVKLSGTNDAEAIVGRAFVTAGTLPNPRALGWTNPTAAATALPSPTVIGDVQSSDARSINNASVAVGSVVETRAGVSSNIAVAWHQGIPAVLPLAPGSGPKGQVAYAINNSGVIAGIAWDASETTHLVLWKPTGGFGVNTTYGISVLTSPRIDGPYLGLDDCGRVAAKRGDGVVQGIFWNGVDAPTVLLPGPTGVTTSLTIRAAHHSGRVVGAGSAGTTLRALVWQGLPTCTP